MLLYSIITIIISIVTLSLLVFSINRSERVSQLNDSLDELLSDLSVVQNSLASTRHDLAVANEQLVNLTPAEAKRLAKRIASKKDNGKKVR